MSSGNVHITDLPAELLLHIFTFLDAEGLIACAGVNATWKEVTNSVGNKIWFQACLKAGIYVKEDKHGNARDWKAFLSSMLPRLKAMQDSTCFTTDQYVEDGLISAIYCHKEKIAIAFSNRIQIRNLCDEEILHEFECSFEPKYLKFDDKILVAASRCGNVSSWSATTGEFLESYTNVHHRTASFTSFDFLIDQDIVANSYLPHGNNNSFIEIWSMSSDNICIMTTNRRTEIGTVMLTPNRDRSVNEQEITCYLFSLTIHCVEVVTVTLQHRHISARASAIFQIPKNLVQRRCLLEPTPCNLLFDGKEVYFTTRGPPVYSFIICAWNFRTYSLRFLENEELIINLLGVGKKYIVYEIEVEKKFKRVVVANKITAEIIAITKKHRNTFGRYDDHLCLADTSWLDGINGENDRGAVCARIAEDEFSVQVTQFVPRNV